MLRCSTVARGSQIHVKSNFALVCAQLSGLRHDGGSYKQMVLCLPCLWTRHVIALLGEFVQSRVWRKTSKVAVTGPPIPI